ncbi:hypothetical protein RJ639_015376 [Escallonia herrerae]|uniref:Peptidase A1 domain-containing protein n=1 Tax=Escallonia herrerae TaxID=1293975 RepID=A0AA89AQ15_9ASTE|nr:hypothetical protein RJ639_015376 [Escallonia herrerae]
MNIVDPNVVPLISSYPPSASFIDDNDPLRKFDMLVSATSVDMLTTLALDNNVNEAVLLRTKNFQIFLETQEVLNVEAALSIVERTMGLHQAVALCMDHCLDAELACDDNWFSTVVLAGGTACLPGVAGVKEADIFIDNAFSNPFQTTELPEYVSRLLDKVYKGHDKGRGRGHVHPSYVIPLAQLSPPRLVTKLIHRDSLLSPFYNASATISDRAAQAIQRDKARFVHLKAAAATRNSLGDILGDIVRGDIGSSFFVSISVGDPPVPQLVVTDTGSSLFWIMCLPCIGSCDNSTAIFYPSKSSSFSPYPCPCDGLGTCDEDAKQCTYYIEYEDGTGTWGIYAYEELTFVTSGKGTITLSNMLFACGHAINNLHGQTRGVLGLGPSSTSVAMQVSNKFSYCIGNISDPEYTYGQLILGDSAIMNGSSTQLDVYNGFYYLTLQGISFGGSSPTNIDGLKLEKANENPLCYKGIVSQDLKDFPKVTFHFSGADLALSAANMFLMIDVGTYGRVRWGYPRRREYDWGGLATIS